MTEVWRAIASSPSYEVSDLGRVRRIPGHRCPHGRILKPRLQKGYLAAHLSENNVQRNAKVHVLVCEAFHGPRPSDAHVAAHNDGNPLNNHASNLRWATRSENALDRHRHGNPPTGEANPNAKLSSEQVAEIRASNASLSEIARHFGVSRNHVMRIRRGTNWATLRREAEPA